MFPSYLKSASESVHQLYCTVHPKLGATSSTSRNLHIRQPTWLGTSCQGQRQTSVTSVEVLEEDLNLHHLQHQSIHRRHHLQHLLDLLTSSKGTTSSGASQSSTSRRMLPTSHQNPCYRHQGHLQQDRGAYIRYNGPQPRGHHPQVLQGMSATSE